MKWRVFGVGADGIAAEKKAVDRLGVKYGTVESVEDVVRDADSIFPAAMERGELAGEFGNFGIYGDNGAGELILAGQRVDEAIAADEDVAAGAGFVPAVAVAAEKYGAAGGVVEEVVFDDDAARRAEQGSAGAVVTDGVAGEADFGCPGEVFEAEVAVAADGGGDGVGKTDAEDFGAVDGGAIGGDDGVDTGDGGGYLHGA